MEWKYVVGPNYVARFKEGKLDFQDSASSAWVDFSSQLSLWKTIEEDGAIVDEAYAKKAHEKFKARKS